LALAALAVPLILRATTEQIVILLMPISFAVLAEKAAEFQLEVPEAGLLVIVAAMVAEEAMKEPTGYLVEVAALLAIRAQAAGAQRAQVRVIQVQTALVEAAEAAVVVVVLTATEMELLVLVVEAAPIYLVKAPTA
jgi:hypothetical protein